VLYLIFKGAHNFLDDFVSGEYHTNLPELRSTLNHYRYLLENDMDISQSREVYRRPNKAKIFDKQQKNGYYSKNKRIQGIDIFLQYLNYCAITVLFLTLGLILQTLASTTYKNRTRDILPVMNDIDQAAAISIHVQAVVSILNLYMFKPDLYYKYDLPKDIFSQYIEEMSDIVSFERTRFTTEFEQKMNSDFCIYVNLTNLPTCRSDVRGIAQKGIVPSVIAIENILMSFKNSYDLIPEGPSKMFASLLSNDLVEATTLISDGIAPAISKIIDERSSELSAMLDESSHIVMNYAIAGLIIAVLIAIYALLYLYPKLLKQRKIVTKTMLLLTPDLIIRNRHLKEFLLRENKRFFGFIKVIQEQEHLYSIASLIEKKSKRIHSTYQGQ